MMYALQRRSATYKATKMARINNNNLPKTRRPKTMQVPLVITTTFKHISDMTGISQRTVANRYHACKAQHPRKNVALEQIVNYQRVNARGT